MLTFGPAAPLLYIVGGVVFLCSAALQKLALVKLYAKPPPLDEQIAERARAILQLLFAVHVTTCFLFYARAARQTGSLWGPQQTKPFSLGVAVMLIYFLVDLFPLRWAWQRDVHAEATGATQKTYQDAREEPFSKVRRYRLQRGDRETSELPFQDQARRCQAAARRKSQVWELV